MNIAPNPFAGLPDEIYDAMCAAINLEFATMTAQGVALDTPTFSMVNPSGRSFDIATGLAYPAKAERARRNPKVGLLLEGLPDMPVVAVAAMAAVRDADFQANVNRYIAETGHYTVEALAFGNPWSVIRDIVWYWTRIIVENTPVRIYWWPSHAEMDKPPQRWDAPAGTVYPISDPAPPGKPAPSSSWPLRDWRELAQEKLDQGIEGHLTVVDEDGFPMPIRARNARLTDDGFDLEIPAGVPWTIAGKASLCFMGGATFIGEVSSKDGQAHFVNERVLPVLPMVQDPHELFEPSVEVRAKLKGRLEQELARRGQNMPHVYEQLPTPTAGAGLREKQFAIFEAETKIREAALGR